MGKEESVASDLALSIAEAAFISSAISGFSSRFQVAHGISKGRAQSNVP